MRTKRRIFDLNRIILSILNKASNFDHKYDISFSSTQYFCDTFKTLSICVINYNRVRCKSRFVKFFNKHCSRHVKCTVKLEEMSETRVFRKRTNSAVVMVLAAFLWFMAPDSRGLNHSSLHTKVTAHRAINLSTLGSFSMERCNWTKDRMWAFLSFISD